MMNTVKCTGKLYGYSCKGYVVSTETVSYSEARDHFAELWDRAVENKETIRLTRRGAEPVVLLAAAEYEGLLETAHLLRSPENAARLLNALGRARAGEDTPRPLDELRAGFERGEGA